MVQTASEETSERITRKALPCFLTSIVMLLLILPVFAADEQKDEDTLWQANLVLQGVLNGNDISPTLLSKADCVLILPGVKKFGFGVGGSGGRGPLLCRSGPDATAAAGPGATGASASDADILTYGKAKGMFAGVSLGGATVEPDNDANYRLYGKTLTATDIVRGTDVKPSGEGKSLVTVLDGKITKHSN